MRTLWTWSAIAALIVGVITWGGVMFWAVAFHRKKKGDDGSAPRQTQYNLPVEIVFTVIPTIIVAVLFGFTVNVQNYVDVKNDAPQEKVQVTAFQWNWQFDVDNKRGRHGRVARHVEHHPDPGPADRPQHRVHDLVEGRHPQLLGAGVPLQA